MMSERETAWLLEGGNGYWTGHDLYNLNPDPNEACRFARRDDAERIRCWLIQNDGQPGRVFSTAIKATEHVWMEKP